MKQKLYSSKHSVTCQWFHSKRNLPDSKILLFHSLNPFFVSSHSHCFLGFFSSLLGAGVGGLLSDALLERKSGGLTFLTLNEEA